MTEKKKTVSLEKRRALKYLAGAAGLVLSSALSKNWVSPSLKAAQLDDSKLSGDIGDITS